ncbi:MAG: hypothetical protein L0H70_00880 [Xanthomonadales bacterium]|nr:hypothetical protein [Xanthomonadales bacterium]
MTNTAATLPTSLFGFTAALSACFALSVIVQAGSAPSEHVRAKAPVTRLAVFSSASYPTACILFRNGFESAPDLLFGDGFELVPYSSVDAGKPIKFVTSGGYTIDVNLDSVTITDVIGLNKVVYSGDQHEYLNGKHIKDWGGEATWDDDRRSLILGDGTKLTLTSRGHPDLIQTTSIYDGHENLQIDNRCNAITHHAVDPMDAQQRDQAQYDGETALFETDATLGTATYSNAYNEGQNFNTSNIEYPLGNTGGYANQSQVRDLYDDPRWSHT